MTNQTTNGYEAATRIARSLEGDKLYDEVTRLDAEVTDEAYIGLEVGFARDGQVSSLIAELTTQFDNGYAANPLGVSFHDLGRMVEDDRFAVIVEHIRGRIDSEREFQIEEGRIDLVA